MRHPKWNERKIESHQGGAETDMSASRYLETGPTLRGTTGRVCVAD